MYFRSIGVLELWSNDSRTGFIYYNTPLLHHSQIIKLINFEYPINLFIVFISGMIYGVDRALGPIGAMVISTRLFLALPSLVVLLAIGRCDPNPTTSIFSGDILLSF